MTLLELADRVETLTGPCRETDAEIWRACEYDTFVWWEAAERASFSRNSTEEHRQSVIAARAKAAAPRYTASLDAAMTLVPANHWVRQYYDDFGVQAEAMCGKATHSAVMVRGATPALALTAAALRARAARQ